MIAEAAESAMGVPAVSVIIPAYCVSAFIGETLDSVLRQSFTDFEVIVVDDGSPDVEELERVVRSRMGRGGPERVRYIRQANRGPSAARNTGLRAARGEYVAFLDGDDRWEPDFLQAQTSYLAAHPGVSLVYTDAWIEGDPLAAGQTYMSAYPSVGEVTLASLLVQRCSIITSAVLASRAEVIAAGMFDESLRYAEDLDLWLRLAKRRTAMAYQCRPLVWRRVHPGNVGADAIQLFSGAAHALDKLASDTALSPSERELLESARVRVRSELALLLAKHRLADGDFAAALAALATVDAKHRSWKTTLAIAMLRLSPRALHGVYMLRERMAEGRLARRPAAVRAEPSGVREPVTKAE